VTKILAALLWLSGSAGFAATIQFVSLPSNTQYGTFNGFASATINGIPFQELICDDYDHTTYMPSGNMTFNLSDLTSLIPLQSARFVDLLHWNNTVTKYQEAAILLYGMQQNGPGTMLDLTGDYQYALWALFTPSVKLPNSTARTLLQDAADTVARGGSSNNAIYSQLRIYTPSTGFTSNQEFLQMVPSLTSNVQAIPEPSPGITVAIGMGVIGLSVGLRRLLQRRTAAAKSGSIPRESEQSSPSDVQ